MKLELDKVYFNGYLEPILINKEDNRPMFKFLGNTVYDDQTLSYSEHGKYGIGTINKENDLYEEGMIYNNKLSFFIDNLFSIGDDHVLFIKIGINDEKEISSFEINNLTFKDDDKTKVVLNYIDLIKYEKIKQKAILLAKIIKG